MFQKEDILQAKEHPEKLNQFLARNDVGNLVNKWAAIYARRFSIPQGDLVTAGMQGVQRAVEDYTETHEDLIRFVTNKIRNEMERQRRRERPSISTVSLSTPTDKEGKLHVIDGIEEPSAGINEIKLDLETALDRLKTDLEKKIFLALQEGLEPQEIINKFQCDMEDIDKVRRLSMYFLAQEKKMPLREAEARLTGKKGFLVEDNPGFAKSLVKDFEAVGTSITWEIYADEAARLLADSKVMRKFDFVVLDIILPRYEGTPTVTQAAGEDLLNVIQDNPDVPPGLILSSVLSLYQNPVNYTSDQIFEYLTALLTRGFRCLPKESSNLNLADGEWKYDFSKICKLLGRILPSEPSGHLIKTEKGFLHVLGTVVYWIPREKVVIQNKLWKEIDNKKIEVITTKRQRELLNRFRKVGSGVDYRDVDEIVRKYSSKPDQINKTRARITLFNEINRALKGTGLRAKGIRKDQTIKLTEQ